MTDGDRDSSGELSSFLHLTGWRPAILALLAGVAGAIGLFLALGEPTEWQARYIVNCNNVASEDFIPAELDIFCEEIAQTAQFPVVLAEVQRQTGLVEEDDYEIVVRQSASSPAIVDVNVVSLNPDEAKSVAIETAIAAIENSLQKRVNGLTSLRDQLDDELQASDLRVAELIREAGGINPSTAYDRAQNDLLDRYARNANPPLIDVEDDEGNITQIEEPEPMPLVAELEANVASLEPLDREYQQLTAQINELSIRRSDRSATIREFNGSLAVLDNERTDSFVISEVVTEETSRISGLLSGVLLFAVPAALVTILLFVIWDLFRKKPAEALVPAEPFDAAGVLDAASQRALPEASVTTLVVVDEDGDELDVLSDEDDDEDEDDESSEDDEDEDEGDDDDEDGDTSSKSKSSRWGRDAGSKAG